MHKNVERIVPFSNTIIIPRNINSMNFFWTVVQASVLTLESLSYCSRR